MNDTARSLTDKLFRPVDIASLVVFRIVFGSAIVVEMFRYFYNDWVRYYWTDRAFLFKYYGFEWVQPLPEVPMHLFIGLVGVLGACVALGLFYRVTSVLLFLSMAYIFLLDQAMYLNHIYLIVLLSGMLCLVPANACFSLDARRRPGIRRETIPFWCLLLIAGQLGIAYFYAGIAKLDYDWINGEPLRIWLWNKADFPLIGHTFRWEIMPYLFAWGGLLLDLLVVPGLLWKRTRAFTLIVTTGFHFMNAQLFPIGIFPWLMIGATTILLPPSWPRTLLKRLDFDVFAMYGTAKGGTSTASYRGVIVTALAIYFTIQLTVPFRHFLYPGNASWTEEGHRFAWRMKLRDKEDNRVTFVVKKLYNGQELRFEKEALNNFLSPFQVRRLAVHPDLMIQFAHYLHDYYSLDGKRPVEVYVYSAAAMNGREAQWMIDSKVNLAAKPRNLMPADWIVPLHEPLPPHEERFSQEVARSEPDTE